MQQDAVGCSFPSLPQCQRPPASLSKAAGDQKGMFSPRKHPPQHSQDEKFGENHPRAILSPFPVPLPAALFSPGPATAPQGRPIPCVSQPRIKPQETPSPPSPRPAGVNQPPKGFPGAGRGGQRRRAGERAPRPRHGTPGPRRSTPPRRTGDYTKIKQIPGSGWDFQGFCAVPSPEPQASRRPRLGGWIFLFFFCPA